MKIISDKLLIFSTPMEAFPYHMFNIMFRFNLYSEILKKIEDGEDWRGCYYLKGLETKEEVIKYLRLLEI